MCLITYNFVYFDAYGHAGQVWDDSYTTFRGIYFWDTTLEPEIRFNRSCWPQQKPHTN
jgi:hypothetical protein